MANLPKYRSHKNTIILINGATIDINSTNLKKKYELSTSIYTFLYNSKITDSSNQKISIFLKKFKR
jgi:hypothetical protein